MKKYQLSLLIGMSLLFGSQVLAEWCATDVVRCYYTDKRSRDGSVEAGKLFGGQLRQYEYRAGLMSCYPVEIENPQASVALCNKIPGCEGDNCMVLGWQNKSGTPGALTPIERASDVCAVAQIDGDSQAGGICRKTCEQKRKKWTGTWQGGGNKDCVSSPNEAGSVCGCI